MSATDDDMTKRIERYGNRLAVESELCRAIAAWDDTEVRGLASYIYERAPKSLRELLHPCLSPGLPSDTRIANAVQDHSPTKRKGCHPIVATLDDPRIEGGRCKECGEIVNLVQGVRIPMDDGDDKRMPPSARRRRARAQRETKP